MARTLTLYRSFQPNRLNEVHYLFTNETNYMNTLLPVKIREIPFNTYRINGGQLLVKNQGVFNIEQAERVAYAIDYDSEEGYMRCYYVTSCTDQSDFTIFNITLDVWATYQKHMRYGRAHITRCNRNIGQGIAPAVVNSTFNPLKQYQLLDPTASALESDLNYKILFICNVVTLRNTLGNVVRSETMAFSKNLREIRLSFASTALRGDTPVDIAARTISSFYAIEGNAFQNNDVQMLRAYIVPAALFANDRWGYRFKGRPPYTGTTEQTIECYYAEPRAVKMLFNVNPENIDLDYEYYLGAQDNGAPLKRYTKTAPVTYEFILNANDMQVLVRQGGDEYDVTKAFEVPLLGVTNSIDGMQTIAQYIKAITDQFGIVKSVTGASSKSGAAIGAITGEANILQRIFSTSVKASGINGQGDALVTFARDFTPQTGVEITQVCNPFRMSCYHSVIDEKKRLYYEGAAFDEYMTISSALACDLLGTGPSQDQTFIMCDELETAGGNAESIDFIKSEFARGIWVVSV